MLKRIFHATHWLSITALLLFAVLLTVVRLWIPSLADYRHDVEQAASEALGRAVTVERMHATWRGLHPVLKLLDVAIAAQDPAQQSFRIPEIWMRLDTAHYLRNRQVQLLGVDIIGADLVIGRDAHGEFYLEQFRNEGGDTGGGIAVLAGMSRLSIHESSITYMDALTGDAPRRFSSVMLSLSNDADQHRLTGYAYLPGDVGYRLEVDALFEGATADIRNWQGRAYVKGQQLSMPSLLKYWLPQVSAQGIADLRLWVDVDALHLSAVTGELDIRDMRIARQADDRMLAFKADSLGVQAGWRKTGDDWHAALRLLSANLPDRQWEPFELSMAGGLRGEDEYLRISAGQLMVDELWQLLPAMPGLKQTQFNQLAALNLSGQLADMDVMLLRTEDGIRPGGFTVQFNELGIAQSAVTPYVAGLDGMVSGSTDAGTLVLEGRDVYISDQRVFRDVLPIDELQGKIHWQRTQDDYRVTSERLALVNPDMALLGKFALTLPASGSGTLLDLHVDVESADVGQVSHYLPAGVMSPTGVAWLDNSLVSGQIRQGTVLIQGRLDQLPFDNGEGRLEVRLPVYSATLDFNDGWTPITGLDAQVDFTGRLMDITSQRGRIRTAALHNVHAQIRDLARPFLTIDGRVTGQLAVMLAELGSSPLGERFGGFVDRNTATGTCSLQLDIDIPLDGTDREVSAAGRITLKDNTLKNTDTDIVLSGIQGELTFDDDGIQGDGLRATLFGRPANVRVWGEPGKPDTHIRLTGPLALFNVMLGEQDPLRKAVTGDSDWQVQVTTHGAPARGKPADVGVRVSSTLAGTAINLPAPLGKPAGSPRPLSVVVNNVVGQGSRVRFDYGDALKGVLQLGNGTGGTRLKRGMVTIGGGEASMPDSPGLLINGRVDSLHLSDWQPWLGEGQAGPEIALRFAVDVGELEVMNYNLHDLHLDAESAGRVWNVTASGPSAKGEIELTQAAGSLAKVVMNMQRLALKKSEAAQPSRDSRVTPANMPDLQVTTGELVYNGTNLGKLELKAVAQADNRYRVERLALSSSLLSMRLDGVWHMTGNNHLSQVNLEVTDGRMGQLLDELGYEKTIKDGILNGSMQASWAAPLWDVTPEIIDGKLNVIIKDGQLLDIEPGASGRALGLLSLGKLPKRLTLDFSDFFAEGFNFERIAGNFVLDHGNAYTNDLLVDGPAAKIEISGRVGLADKDYDELVTVTPYLQSSLPLAGAIAGGPAGAAVVIVAEKLLGDKLGLNKMASKQYVVKGSWDAPEVTQINLKSDADKDVADVIDEDF
jgi:uncharacterized protein (TIGR02099 family)